MKLLTKFKDYYDYLTGIYENDEKLVLDRRKFTTYASKLNYFIVSIHIGEWLIQGLWMNNTVHFGKNIEQFSTEFLKYNDWGKKGISKETHYKVVNKPYRNDYILKVPTFLGDKSPTWKEDCPIVMNNMHSSVDPYYEHNPILREYNVQSILSPQQVYEFLTSWLSKRVTKNEKTVPIGDDNVRILAHGFDTKTSFRPKIKV